MYNIDYLTLKKFLKYCFAGVANTFLGYSLIFLAMYVFKWTPGWSNFFGYAVGFCYGYLLNKLFIFKNKNSNIRSEWFNYAAVYIISFFFNLGMLHLLIDHSKFNAALAQILAGVVYTICSFTLYNVFVFKHTTLKISSE